MRMVFALAMSALGAVQQGQVAREDQQRRGPSLRGDRPGRPDRLVEGADGHLRQLVAAPEPVADSGAKDAYWQLKNVADSRNVGTWVVEVPETSHIARYAAARHLMDFTAVYLGLGRGVSVGPALEAL